MTQDDDYTDSDESLSDASYSDLDADDFLDDIEASEPEEGEEKEAAALPKPKPKPKPKAVPPRKSYGAAAGEPELGGANNIVGKRLKPPNVVQVSTKMLFDEMESKEIDLDAEYQRDVVWPDKNQSKLIDSIFRNYYIPPVVFSRQDRGMQEVKICVDGKQRLTSIKKFMKGEIPFIERKTGKKYFWKTPTKKPKGWTLLSDAWKSEFQRTSITTVTFSSLTPAEERDIFARVQLGMALSTPEKWQALQGPWPDFLRELRSSYFSEDRPESNLLAKINWDMSRAKDFQDVVRMAIMINQTIIKDEPPIVSTDKLGEALEDEDGPSHAFKMEMLKILETFLRLVKEPRYYLAFEGKVAPVELVMIAVLIGKGMHLAKDSELAEGIKDMRREVRSQVAKGYVMWKPEIVRKMLNFIDRWKLRLKRPLDPSTVAAAQSAAVVTVSNGQRKKRKAMKFEDSSEEEALEDRNVRPRSSAYSAAPGLARIPKKENGSAQPIKPEPRGVSFKIGNSNVTPQRVAPAPMVSRETVMSQSGARPMTNYNRAPSSLSSFRTEQRSPVETKPPVSLSTSHPAPPAPAGSTDGMTLEESLDLVSTEITTLQELVMKGGRPDHQELAAKLKEKQTLKSQLQRDRFMRDQYRRPAARPFGQGAGALGF
ncbi:hypothetical protein CALVIDRAFT_540344 [Calocera viscosa TUFC12733]|uniref:GmrSD restriction endonucleases N-terminal domain-containing protein n=1 Tax=Calocera viscosa (strain TUFC12733) TaxID=1330018 RepID=A0A167IYS6_CALVF|nr:hypothetical protein CALVIDRAFT_540344 [Calocera viscosa TUFC12733]